jgi:hypothetical protein
MSLMINQLFLILSSFQGELSDENLKTSLKLKLQLNGDSGSTECSNTI